MPFQFLFNTKFEIFLLFLLLCFHVYHTSPNLHTYCASKWYNFKTIYLSRILFFSRQPTFIDNLNNQPHINLKFIKKIKKTTKSINFFACMLDLSSWCMCVGNKTKQRNRYYNSISYDFRF
jgi:hypothetical protein